MSSSLALPAPPPRPRQGGARRRWHAKLALAAVVALAHGWLLRAWTPPTAVDAALAALQVRQIAPSSSAGSPPKAARPDETERAAGPANEAESAESLPRALPDGDRARRSGLAQGTPAHAPPPARAEVPASEEAGPAAGDGTPAEPRAFDLAALSVPIHDVDLPPGVQLRYQLQRAGREGEATLHWQRDGMRYRVEVSGSIAGVERFGWVSQGGFDAAGLAPERFVVRRRDRDTAAVNFRRDADPAITFSGPQLTRPRRAGVQDRASWLVQLAAIVRALPAAAQPGRQVALPVVGPRGDLSLWVFTAAAPEPLDLPEGAVAAAQPWRREAVRPRDLELQVWLDPARGQLPVQLRMTARPDGGSTEWRLRALQSP